MIASDERDVAAFIGRFAVGSIEVIRRGRVGAAVLGLGIDEADALGRLNTVDLGQLAAAPLRFEPRYYVRAVLLDRRDGTVVQAALARTLRDGIERQCGDGAVRSVARTDAPSTPAPRRGAFYDASEDAGTIVTLNKAYLALARTISAENAELYLGISGELRAALLKAPTTLLDKIAEAGMTIFRPRQVLCKAILAAPGPVPVCEEAVCGACRLWNQRMREVI